MDAVARVLAMLNVIAILSLSLSLFLHKREPHNAAEADIHRCNIEWEA